MPPAPFHRGMDRERAALGMSGRGRTTRTLRRGLRSAATRSLCAREKGRACLFSANLLFFPANVRVRRGGARAIGRPKHIFGVIKQITREAAR